ncbi:MAG: 16S rRNA (uracil(1498)-N(3))-methyltransferase [Pontimonas sp.]|nr:16S rRNA (uracil(1498)-N(3))-methyltransferase [Pontimonas sp.]
MAHLYYVPSGDSLEAGVPARLVGDEARHAATVGRLGIGEEILIGDGAGTLATARATGVGPKEVVLEVVDTTFHPRPKPEVWLVQALAKGDRDELAIQTCTELGVDRIIPWQAARSVSLWKGDKVIKGVARWQKIAAEASKQSLRPWIPTVDEAMTTQEIAELGGVHQLLLLDPGAPDALSAYIPDRKPNVLVMVGPEGGIEPSEKELLMNSGALDLRLGSTVLRTSSAGPAALALLNSSLGRW